MLKKTLWTLPVLAIGIAIGGLTLPNVFASGNTNGSTSPAPAYQMMQQNGASSHQGYNMMNNPQAQGMYQACTNFMGQYFQNKK